jgi:polyisoprenoid-binding protein YceI
MLYLRKIIKGSIASILLILPFFVASQTNYRVKSHEIRIEGTSNIQSWSADVEKVNGTFSLTLEDGKIAKLHDVSLSIEAGSIIGSEGRMMNSKIYDALDIKNHPTITFALREVLSLSENPGTARISSRGVLTIAGVSRLVTLNTAGRVLPNGDLEFTGTQKVKMSDHRISPPTAMLGALRTGDEVTLNYKVVLQSN